MYSAELFASTAIRSPGRRPALEQRTHELADAQPDVAPGAVRLAIDHAHAVRGGARRMAQWIGAGVHAARP